MERNEYEVDGIHDYIGRSYIRRSVMDRILAVEAAGMTDKDTIVDIEDEHILVAVHNLAILGYYFYNLFDFDVHI